MEEKDPGDADLLPHLEVDRADARVEGRCGRGKFGCQPEGEPTILEAAGDAQPMKKS
jgi:hypothetical protein